jgi:hypothetical protein
MFPICGNVKVPELGNTRVLVADTDFQKRSCSAPMMKSEACCLFLCAAQFIRKLHPINAALRGTEALPLFRAAPIKL